VVALEHYPADRNQMQAAVRTVAQAAARADAIFIPDGANGAGRWWQALGAAGVDLKRCRFSAQACGRIRRFSPTRRSRRLVRGPMRPASVISPRRFRARYGQDPARTASLAYDAVALISALAKTRAIQRSRASSHQLVPASPASMACSASAPDGTNQRGLA